MTNEQGAFSRAMANGLLATIAWVLVLIVYTVFKALKIEDPTIGNVFQLVTGMWLGILTLAHQRRQADAKVVAEDARDDVDSLKERVRKLEKAGD